MKDYFIILPHAGAIRSGYRKIEQYISSHYEVIYIDYNSCINKSKTNFNGVVEGILQYLSKVIIHKNAELVFFAHSMGSCVLQALEHAFVEQYFVKLFIHSDGDILANVKDSYFRNMTDGQIRRIFDEEYDIPDGVRSNNGLNNFFENRLLWDLKILDTIPNYTQAFGYPKLANETAHKVFISRAFNFADHKKEWLTAYPILSGNDFYSVPGGHYYILEKFNAITTDLY